MLISCEYYNKLDPRYKKVILELENNLNSSDDYKIKTNFIVSFSEKFLMPKEYWKLLSNFSHYLTLNSYYHFYYDKTIGFRKNQKDVYLKLLGFRHDNLKFSFPETWDLLEKDISYPHCMIKKCFKRYEEHSYSLPLTTTWKQYKKMKNLFDKIKAVKSDSNQWFQILQEAQDDEFVSHNVEYRLGSNLLDKDLWNLYIEFLRLRNPEEMLQVYSKYCRFFISDLEMKEKYRRLNYELGPVEVSWKNLFDFELKNVKSEFNIDVNYGDEIVELENPPSKKVESPSMDIKKLVKDFFDTCSYQNFSFSNPVIRYILDKASHILLRKLYQSCKYFYAKKQVPICYRFEMSQHVVPNDSIRNFKYDKETFESDLTFNDYSMLNKYYVSTVLRSSNYEWDNRRLLSTVISRFYQCDAKYISISDQNLYFDEFKFLIEHGNVIKLDCQDVRIEYSENQPVILEDIMAFLPNIKVLQLFNFIKATSNTATVLKNQKFNNKFDFFKVAFSYGEFFDFFDFWHFIKKNGDQNLTLSVFFDKNFNEETVEKFSKIISNCQLLTTQISKKLHIGHGEYYPSILD